MYIIDLGISFIVGKLLASIPAVEKQLIKTIFEDKVIQFCINTLGLAEVLKALIPYLWYSMKSPKIKVCLEDGSKIIVLRNIGVEISVITK